MLLSNAWTSSWILCALDSVSYIQMIVLVVHNRSQHWARPDLIVSPCYLLGALVDLAAGGGQACVQARLMLRAM